jgi:basic membrane protein A
MKNLRIGAILLVSAGLLAGSPAMSRPAGAQRIVRAPAINVGLVTDKGGLNDKSFNHLADLGLLRAESSLGISGSVLQSKTAADYQPNLTKFAQQKKSLVIAVGFLMENALYHVAKTYTSEHFAIIDGAPADDKGNTVNLPNVANLFFKPEQSGYLVGVIAGLLEKRHLGPKPDHNTVGSIAGANFIAVTAYNCGYQEGVWSVDPSAKVLIDFDDGTFQNTANAKAIGQKQISKGADILFQVDGGAGLGYLQAAQAAHKYGIGVDADQDYLGDYVLTSALKKVDQAVFVTIKRLKAGNFHAGDNYFSLSNGATGFATDTHHVPASVKNRALAIAKKIASGAIKVSASCSLGKK